MRRPTDRRTVLVTVGAAAVAGAAGPGASQSTDASGAVLFEGGALVPGGSLEVYLEDYAIEDRARRRIATSHFESDGRSKTIAFSLSSPANSASATVQVVARLERSDGWLLARGSAPFEAGSPVLVKLRAVLY